MCNAHPRAEKCPLNSCHPNRYPCALRMLGKRFLLAASFPVLVGVGMASPLRAVTEGVRLEPHYYAGPRGFEPLFQSNFSVWKSWKTDRTLVSAHAEFETQGRLDRSIDLDRAWVVTEGRALQIFWGRMHPWEVIEKSGGKFTGFGNESGRPWSLLGSAQAQNRGVLLGAPGSVFPSPVLLGWIGPHAWVSSSESWGAGFSITPFFVPSLGSEVTLGDETSAGRFGRRPPGYIDVNGTTIPIRYRIDRSRIWEDVLFRPQAMAQARWRYHESMVAWAFVSYAPRPDPSPETSGYVQVTDATVHAVAEVKPSFPYQWLAGLSHEYSLDQDWQLFLTVSYQQTPRWGYEAGVKHLYGALSYLNETPSGDDRYTDELVQFELQYPLSVCTPYAGIKRHLGLEGTWLRAGLRASLGSAWSFDLGSDIFAGGEESYFGEWRTNDRVYGVLRWAF